MRGRKPKPTAMHKLEGTLNATRHKARAAEPKAEGALMEAPAWMPDAQRSAWDYAVEHAPAGVLAKIDRGVLAVWVAAEDMHRTAAMMQAKLDSGSRTPLLTKGKGGLPVPSPYLGIMLKAAMTMLKAGSELGFSPASRPRMSGSSDSAQPVESQWDKLVVIPGGKA